MSATARLLQAASKILGGDQALAKYLDIPVSVLQKFIHDPSAFPDALLLRTIDLIQGDREERSKSGKSDVLPPNALLDPEAPR
jgi:hypothetical protein